MSTSDDDDAFERLRVGLGDVPKRMRRSYRRWLLSRLAVLSVFVVGSALAVSGFVVWRPLGLVGFMLLLATSALATRRRRPG